MVDLVIDAVSRHKPSKRFRVWRLHSQASVDIEGSSGTTLAINQSFLLDIIPKVIVLSSGTDEG